jgi:AraC-like DNA-binding protein
MSQSAFAHLFKSVTGVSPYQFVKRLRLDQARVLLVEERRSVTEAAATVGYSSLSHFINEFKRHFGVTPGVYAESVRDTLPFSVAEVTSR